MPRSTANIIPVQGKDIVIIGDGPIGLLAALLLKLNGVASVTLVGPRLGEFARSGDINPKVFKTAEAAIAPLTVKPSETYHLKDIERQLYSHAQDLGITLLKKNLIASLQKNN